VASVSATGTGTEGAILDWFNKKHNVRVNIILQIKMETIEISVIFGI